jgi:hypothetical protein
MKTDGNGIPGFEVLTAMACNAPTSGSRRLTRRHNPQENECENAKLDAGGPGWVPVMCFCVCPCLSVSDDAGV